MAHPTTTLELFQAQMIAFLRAFGLHQPAQTPCGQAVSVAEAHALLELSTHTPRTQNDLARALRLEKSTISRMVAHLERRGWITRQPHHDDARARAVLLTEAGAQQAQELAHARAATFAAVLAHIPADEQANVLHALHILTEALYDYRSIAAQSDAALADVGNDRDRGYAGGGGDLDVAQPIAAPAPE